MEPSASPAPVRVSAVPLVVITGATRGIGKAAAVELARQGAEVAIVGREPERVEAVAAEARATGGAPVHEHVADLTLMASVRTLADELRDQYEHIDVLANNAGALFASRRETEEGFERTFALNHLAPFLLTNLVRDRLDGGRVVTTASDAHTGGRLDLGDLQSKGSSYAAMRVYGTSKLCNILFTRELARRAPELHANCFHPGVVRTGFGKNENGIWKLLTTLGSPFFRSPERGARSLVWLATSDEAANLNGEYVEDEKVATPSAQAQDDELARGLWERSAELAGLAADAPA
jgi:NAD(P)-dependent dehydrogenase (short-subunit alcohol dehydrogenase family)